MSVASAVEAILGPDLPIAVRTYDGSRLGPIDAPARSDRGSSGLGPGRPLDGWSRDGGSGTP